MRTVNFNGYIDDEVFWGDEITPESLHDSLYGPADNDDVTLIINSYGGSCSAARKMFDDIRNYPGRVKAQIQVAASSATSVSAACDEVEMTPMGIYMIHLPSTFAWGNQNDLKNEIAVLDAYTEAIINSYAPRCEAKGVSRDDIRALMDASTWMDATMALQKGFIDSISEAIPKATNAAGRTIDRAYVQDKIKTWEKRTKNRLMRANIENVNASNALTKRDLDCFRDEMRELFSSQHNTNLVSADQLYKRLNLLK